MISMNLKQTALFLALFFAMFSAMSKADEQCIKGLVKKYLTKEEAQEEKKGEENTATEKRSSGLPVLSIKGDCEKYKAKATMCCSNPNQCSGFALDMLQHIGPLLPSLYQTYESYRTSKDLSSEKLSHEEAVQKMCTVSNEMALGGFGTGLLGQMAPLVKKTCKGRMDKCEKQCNKEIEEFRNAFKQCFGPQLSEGFYDSTVESIFYFANDIVTESHGMVEMLNTTQVDGKFYVKLDQEEGRTDIEVCADNDIEEEINTEKQIRELEDCKLAYKKSNEENQAAQDASQESPRIETISAKTVGYIILFDRAYRNSSSVKKFRNMSHLSERSIEKEIVNCSHQPDRVVTQRRGPSSPVPSPHVQLCQKVVEEGLKDQYVQDNIPPPGTPGRTTPVDDGSGSFVGETPSDGQASWMYPTEDHGIQEEENWRIDDELPDPLNKPPLAKLSDQSGSSGSGTPGPGGGGVPSGGGLAPPSKEGSSSSPSYPRVKGGGGSFVGGGGGGGGGYPRMAGGSGMRLGKGSPKGKNVGKIKPMPRMGKKNLNSKKGLSIFQIASQRIQAFCIDVSCLE